MENFNTLLTLSELKEHYGSPPVGICPLYNGKLDKTIVESKTGNPIVLPRYKAITSLNISFSPKQAGSGDPSPENIRPISGWDKVPVIRCGKNLIDVSKIDQSTPGGDVGTSISVNFPLSITISANYSAATILANSWRFKIDFFDGATKYAYDNELNGTKATHATFNGTQENPITSITYRRTYITSGEISNVMCNIGSTPTPYEPYQGDTYDITLSETVYGGTVDAVTGVGSKTWGFIASYNGEALPGEWISDRDVYAPGTTPATGAQVAYKLATPEPFKVNPISIPSLSGINTIYSDADNLSCDIKISSFWSDDD